MAFPGLSFAPDGGLSAMNSLSGAGLPGGSVSSVPTRYPVQGFLSGIGMDGSMTFTDAGKHSSSSDQVSNPRHLINTQYFVDTETTNIHTDLGNMEVHFMDVHSGPPGCLGQNKPHNFKSLPRMNWWLAQPEQAQLGKEKTAKWWDDRFSTVGILRHDLAALPMNDSGHGQLCQTFTTGGRTRCMDMWQAHDRDGAIGPEIGDLLHIVLRRYEKPDELDRHLGVKNPRMRNIWQWGTYYTKANEDVPIAAYYDPTTGVMGKSEVIGRVASIYGAPSNSIGARAIARKILYHPTADASYKADLIKLRQLEIEVGLT